MTFLELVERVLREQKKPLTANQIWQQGIDKGYDKQLNSEGKTPWATLGAQIYVNAKDNPKSLFAQTDSRPKKFYLKSQASQLDLTIEATAVIEEKYKKKKFDFIEEELRKYLTYYAYYHLNCYTKTINHSQSTKKEYGQWVHPDVVGCFTAVGVPKESITPLLSVVCGHSSRANTPAIEPL